MILRRSIGLALLAAAAIVPAGCGGPSAPAVAHLTTASAAPPAPRASKTGDATGLLVEWAACMRNHGDPDQTDPSIDDHWQIDIVVPLSAPPTLSNEVHGGTAPCNEYLAAAGGALRAAHPAPPPPSTGETGVRYAACMRANGVPGYPDPTGSRTDLNGIDMNSPFFIRANKVCGEKIGAPAWWINGWGPPGNISVTSGPPPGAAGARTPVTTTG